MVDDFEALKGFTSEKYKEKVKQRRAKTCTLIGLINEGHRNYEKQKKERKMVQKLFHCCYYIRKQTPQL